MKKLFLTSSFCRADKNLNELSQFLNKPIEKNTVAFIPTAADPYVDRWFVEADRDKLLELGFIIKDIDLKDKRETQLLEELKNIDIIFVAGGNAFYLLEKMKESGFDKIAKELITKGVIYMSSSAGSCVAGPNIEPIKLLDDPGAAPGLQDYRGLNLVDFIVLPHYESKEKYTIKIKEIMDKYGSEYKFIPLTDEQIITVNDNKI